MLTCSFEHQEINCRITTTMATRRNRIVVKPNLKPAVPKSSSTIQKTKTPVSTLQASSESASITGKHPVPAAPSEKSITQVTSETEKKKGIEKGSVELQSGGDFDGGPESVPVKQKLNAHLLKKSVVSNQTEEFAKETEGLDKLTDGSISVCSGVKETTITDNTNAEHGKKESSIVSKENEIHKEIESEPAAVDSTISHSLNDHEIPTIDVCVVDKPATPSTRSSQDDMDQADTQTASNKPGDVSADVREPATDEVASQPKVQRKKREKKERKDPLPPSDKSPDRHKMRMSDLIVWNPAQNYFPKKKKANNNPPVKKEERPKTPESIISMDDESSNQSNSLPAPRVMIGPDGNIVLDTQSLIIETPKDDTDAKTIIEEDDDDRYLNSNSYRKTSKTKIWTEKENEKFFIGLSMCGTDFSLMCNLLPKRTRRELKNKFRREEKRNRFLIDKALSSRQPYDMTPFKRMEEEETAKLKEALQIKKEVKRKCKEEAKEERLKKIKKEKRRATKKRKTKESEDEEDDWGDEPEYDDDYYEEEENRSEENDDENNIEAHASAARPKKRKMAQNKRSQSQSVININSATPPNPRRVFTPIDKDVNQPFVPPGMSAPYIPTVIEAIDDDNENSRLISNQPSTLLPSVAQPSMPYHPHNLQSAANSSSTLIPRHIGASSNNTAGLSQGEMAATGLRSIPGTAPIQIEMEGVTNPMQGVLIPSHLVPQLAPQLGIPASSTPMQVLLVQEEGRTGGNMVHVYVLPEKESSPFPQVGQGRVAADGSGGGLTLTSPIASPHPPSRRPSSSSTPTPASPFSPPPLGQQSSHSFPFRSPPQTSTTPGPSADLETSMSTLRNVYGNAMSSITTPSSGKEKVGRSTLGMSHSVASPQPLETTGTNQKIYSNPIVNPDTTGGNVPSSVSNSGQLTVLSSHHPPPQFTNQNHHLNHDSATPTALITNLHHCHHLDHQQQHSTLPAPLNPPHTNADISTSHCDIENVNTTSPTISSSVILSESDQRTCIGNLDNQQTDISTGQIQ